MADSKRSNKSESQDIAARAVEQLENLMSRPIEAVTGLAKDGDEWTVTLEVLELERVPSTTDVIGKYEVTLDKDGEMTGLERTRRFPRAEAGEV
jgi:Gas vesicle synthesis protein GvpO